MNIFYYDTCNLTKEQLEKMYYVLPEQRKLSTSRFSHPLARRESIMAAYLMFFALVNQKNGKTYLQCSTQQLFDGIDMVAKLAVEIGWNVGSRGKPFENGINIKEKTVFTSLSHSGGIAAVALSDNPIGVDIQRVPTFSRERIIRISERFHQDEQKQLYVLSDDEITHAFCRIWSCKESALKLCGLGLSMPLSSFCVRLDNTCEIRERRIKMTACQINDFMISTAQWE